MKKKISQTPHLRWHGFIYSLKHWRKILDFKTLSLFHLLKYLYCYLQSIIRKKPYKTKDSNFYYYGIKNITEWLNHKSSLLVVGFSYCQKPHDCPSNRFSTNCCNDTKNPICRECFISRCHEALSNKKNTTTFCITTAYSLGKKLTQLLHRHKSEEIIFIITACDMSLQMFGDMAHMLSLKGIGARIEYSACSNITAFNIAEKGKKNKTTDLSDSTKKKMLDILQNKINL
jgi:hypothetical protein